MAIRTRAHDLGTIAALGVYAIGLMTMLACSALYNLTEDGPRKRLYRRLDHAAIFLMIAGTYTPFALVALGGVWGIALLAVVWVAAAVGIAVELLGLRRHDGLSVAAYLLLGWTVLPALGRRCGGTAAGRSSTRPALAAFCNTGPGASTPEDYEVLTKTPPGARL